MQTDTDGFAAAAALSELGRGREWPTRREGTAAQGSNSHQEGAGGLKRRKRSGKEKCECTELCSDSQEDKVKTCPNIINNGLKIKRLKTHRF